MRHGLTILPEHSWREAAPMWRAADDLGFDHAWTYDHLVWSGLPDRPWFAAVPTLAAAATVTGGIQVCSCLTSCPVARSTAGNAARLSDETTGRSPADQQRVPRYVALVTWTRTEGPGSVDDLRR